MRLLTACLLLVPIAVAQSTAPIPQQVATQAMNSATSSITPGAVTPKNDARITAQPDIPPMPSGKVSLLGGTIQRVDHVRDQLTLQIFGGGLTTIRFDERTRVVRQGGPAILSDLRPGLRVYVDTTLDGTKIFARNVRLAAGAPMGTSRGQLVEVDVSRGELRVRDSLSPEPVKMNLSSKAEILRGNSAGTAADLKPGALVTLAFTSDGSDTPTVRSISILASPGADFIFSGHVEHLDLHRGLMVLVDPRDNQSYEVHVDPSLRRQTQNLQRGANVTVQTQFDGRHYEAHSITVNPAPQPQSPNPDRTQ